MNVRNGWFVQWFWNTPWWVHIILVFFTGVRLAQLQHNMGYVWASHSMWKRLQDSGLLEEDKTKHEQ